MDLYSLGDTQCDFIWAATNKNHMDDWYVSDEILDAIRLVEYRIYELECVEVLIDNDEEYDE